MAVRKYFAVSRGVWLEIRAEVVRSGKYERATVTTPRAWAGDVIYEVKPAPDRYGFKSYVNSYTSSKGMPRVHKCGKSIAPRSSYFCAEPLYKISDMSDESFITEQIKRFKNMKALFAASPEAIVPKVCPQSACPNKTVVINYDYSALCEFCEEEGKCEILETCPDGTAKRWKTCVLGLWIEDEKECISPICAEGQTRNETYCPDGVTKKSWEECVTGTWVAKTQTCPEVECYRNVIIYKSPYPSDPKYIIWTKNVGGSGTEAYDNLEQCKRYIDSTIKLGFTYNQCGEVVECTEGEKRNVVLCPDGEFMKSWEECVTGTWVAKTGVCGCASGTISCQGYDLYICVDGEWVLKERNSVECGYTENGKISILDPIISWIETSFDVDRKTAEMYAYLGIAGIGAVVVLGVMSK